MLLQGAYSAKYRAARQETVENIRDEERQEFNVKLEKNKELSRDTNRRRRALEQRRKDYEAEEERKRREILAQRKKQIQEATEKFQRANFVRSRKKTNNHYLDRSKANKKVKHEPGLVTKHTKSEVNGQPYYPSVEEVLAMLHADRADVIERLSSGETHDPLLTRDYDYAPVRTDDLRAGSPSKGQSPVPYYNTNDSSGSTEDTKVTSEQQIIDQEKLRSEVVGRTQPMLAFGDGTKDITEGVLPTTIRRNSPSGSLSSLDSLDEVPDEVLEPAGAGPVPDVMENPLEGIIRKAGKIKSGSRVTFNESVIFSDGFVGTLKKKPEVTNDASNAFGIEKQNSYFEIMEQERIDNETPGIELPKYLDTNANVVVPKCLQDTPVSRYPPETFTRSTTVVNKYTVSTADVTPGCVTGYSITNGSLTNGGTDSINEIKNSVTTPVRNSDSLRRGQYCVPRDIGGEQNSYAYQMAVRKSPVTSGNAIGDNTRETVNTVVNGEKPLSIQNVGHGVQTHGEISGFHVESQSNTVDGKTIETRVPFSSINGSMLKDSLEMSYGNMSSQSQSSTEPTHTPNVESRMRATEDVEALPETPLIPVTKKDFLSKALLRATNNAHDDLKSRTGALSNSKQREGVKSGYNTNGVLHNGHHFTGNVPNASETAKLNGYKSDVYTQGNEYGTRNSSGLQGHNGTTGVVPSASDTAKRNGYESDMYKQGYKYGVRDNGGIQGHNGTSGVPNGNDAIKQYGYESDGYKQGYGARNIREVQVHNGTNGVIPNGSDATRRNGYESDRYIKQEYEYGARKSRGVQGQGGMGGNNSSKTSPKLRMVTSTTNKGPLTNGQPVEPKARSPAWNASGIKNVQEGRISTATRKGNSAEDLLKSVQEDIERIRMFPAQQNASGTYSDQGAVPSANYKSRPKPTVSYQGRKPTKKSPNGSKAKEGTKRLNSATKRLHKPSGESGSGTRKQANSAVNIQYASSPSDNKDYSTSNPNLTYNQNHSPSQDTSSRLPDKGDPNSETRSPLEYYSHREPPWTSTFEKKQRRNREGLEFLDKTPTDEEINTLWETVRTCLKHEQSHKAASDSIVNNIRHSRSESGPLVGNHYLIDNNRWGPKPRAVTNAFGLNSTGSEPRQATVGGRVAFRRQNSLDGFERRGSSDSTASLPVRKGSLLEHRKHKTERRLPRAQQSSRPPLNPQSFQARRGPVASASGPQKSNTVKAEEPKLRPHLSYAEFQAVMQASADLQTRNNEGETQRRPQQALHQPIIMNYRKEPSALSLEEKRLLESLDRLNERLKVQEGFSGKLTKGQVNPNIQASPSKFLHTSPSNSRFGSNRNSGHKSLATSPSLLNRR